MPQRPSRSGEQTLLSLGAVSGFLAVAFGAFGAHSLRDRLGPELLAIFNTGAHYQLIHAVALVAVAGLLGRWEAGGDALVAAARHARRAGWLFACGTVVFSGSLYLLAVTNTRWLGAITPLGGVCFLTGWVSLFLAANAAGGQKPEG